MDQSDRTRRLQPSVVWADGQLLTAAARAFSNFHLTRRADTTPACAPMHFRSSNRCACHRWTRARAIECVLACMVSLLLLAWAAAARGGASATALASAHCASSSVSSTSSSRRALDRLLHDSRQHVASMQELLALVRVGGAPVALPPPLPSSSTRDFESSGGTDAVKQAAVRDAIRHSWRGYASTCMGEDEYNSITGGCDNWLGGVGNTLIDSLDTLFIAGLRDEFAAARAWVAAHSAAAFARVSARGHSVSFFESTIRILGGLLAAHHLSGDSVFAAAALDIGTRLARAFDEANGAPSGMPRHSVDLGSGRVSGALELAEVGSVQLEFFQLARVAGDDSFRAKAQRVIDQLERMPKRTSGLYPVHLHAEHTGRVTFRGSGNSVTVSALGDSFYEYLLKCWLQAGGGPGAAAGAGSSGRAEHALQYLRMYREASNAILRHLYVPAVPSQRASGGGWAYVGASLPTGFSPRMDHLACFLPGMLALGVHRGAVTGTDAARHLAAAKDLAETCVQMYRFTATGIAPDSVSFNVRGEMFVYAPANLLRPETVESLFILWRVTKQRRWRAYGWQIFEAFVRHCRNARGFAGLQNVEVKRPKQKSRQESFWTAETLKYLYLLFSDDATIPLDDYVFNTEAHPLPVFRDAATRAKPAT